MVSIITSGLLLCTSFMVITQGRDILNSVEMKDLNTRMFFYLCLTAMINNICYSGIMVMSEGIAYEFLMTVVWCTSVAFMGIVVYLLAYLLDTDEQRTKLYTSVILYLGIIFYIVDILLKGSMTHVKSLEQGLAYEPVFRRIVIGMICAAYIYFIISMVLSYRSRRNRKREYVIFRLIIGVCVITIGSILLEAASVLSPLPFIPFHSLGMVVVTWCMKMAYRDHALLAIRREDYEEVLESNSHEPVVICDDEGHVIFINKCAAIAIVDEKEPVIGKKLDMLFDLNGRDEYYTPHAGMFTITSIYKPTGRRCNLTVQNVYDAYGEVFTNIITVYRLEYTNPLDQNAAVIKENQLPENPADVIDVTNGASILLIDDSPSALAMLEGAMKPYEMKIEKAYSGTEAVQFLKDGKRYDMLFIDHMMPEMDGIDTARQIRALEGDYFSKVPIVFCSATSIEENLSEFLKVRFNDFLSKPISIKELSDILTRWLWKRVTQDKAEEETREVIRMSARLNIPGIDENLAAEYIGDNQEMYRTLLQTFRQDMDEMLQELERNYQQFDRMRFRILAHAIYNACKGIGATGLAGQSDQLEQACIREDNAYIEGQIHSFLTEFRELLGYIEQYLKTSAG